MSAPTFRVGDAVIWPNGVPGYVRGVDGDLLLDDCGGWINSADVDLPEPPAAFSRSEADAYHDRVRIEARLADEYGQDPHA